MIFVKSKRLILIDYNQLKWLIIFSLEISNTVQYIQNLSVFFGSILQIKQNSHIFGSFSFFLLSFICSANSILCLLSTLQQMKPPTITTPHLYSPFPLPNPSIFTGKGRWWWVLREVQTLRKGGVGVNGHCRGGGGEHVDG